MAYTYGVLPAFSGVRMDLSESLMRADQSPDACNMDSRAGDLRTATGFSRALQGVLPETPVRMTIYPCGNSVRFLALTQNALYYYHSSRREWRQIHTFETTIHPERVDFLGIRLGSADRLLILYGTGQAVTYNATTQEVEPFGSAEKLSDVHVSLGEMYFGRLFAAGNMLEPSRLYWSKAPGGDRMIDDWRQDPASENVSGGFADIGIGDEPITGLWALSNQLLIFTRNNMYRLLGDRPSNYRIVEVDAAFQNPVHTACVRYADRLYFLTDSGLCFYDGQTVRRTAQAKALLPLLKTADLSGAVAAACGDTLYFAFRASAQSAGFDTMIEYDITRDCCMLRSGFLLADLVTHEGKLYAVTVDGRVVRFDDSTDYDGAPISAWWRMPATDLGHREMNKTLLSLTASGAGTVAIRAESNGGSYETQATFSETPLSVAEIPLRGVGRVFTLRFSNVNGQPMRLDAKAALLFDLQRRPV